MTNETNILFGFLIFSLIFISGCGQEEITESTYSELKTREGAEKTAERFARYWEQKDPNSMYDFFIPLLKEKRNKEDFSKFFLASENETTPVIRLDQIRMDSEDVVYAYYTVSSSIFDAKAPAMKLEYIDGRWLVNGFVTFFTETCSEKCIELECKKFSCSKETEFKCKYENSDCPCNTEWDCPNDRPVCIGNNCQAIECKDDKDCKPSQEFIDNCESKAVRFTAKNWCSYGECKFSCTEDIISFKSPTEERNAMLNVKINIFEKIVEVKNFDQDLTNVVIVVNEKYKKQINKISKNENLNLEKTEFLDDFGRDLPEGRPINSVYLYSRQGKYWY